MDPAAPAGPARRRFRGRRDSPASPALVVVEDAVTGELLGPLVHHVHYSPTGLNWGYHGAGPRELARCLLAAVLAERAACPDCAGYSDWTGRAGPCCCRDGLRRDLPDTALTDQLIAHLGSHWTLTDTDLLRWCQHHSPAP